MDEKRFTHSPSCGERIWLRVQVSVLSFQTRVACFRWWLWKCLTTHPPRQVHLGSTQHSASHSWVERKRSWNEIVNLERWVCVRSLLFSILQHSFSFFASPLTVCFACQNVTLAHSYLVYPICLVSAKTRKRPARTPSVPATFARTAESARIRIAPAKSARNLLRRRSS